MLQRLGVIVVIAVVGLTATACGSGSSGPDHMGNGPDGSHGPMHGGGRGSGEQSRPVETGARVVEITGDDFTFSPDALELAAGEDIALELTSEDIEHDVTVEGVGHVVHAEPGAAEQGGLRLDEPGTYAFWCSISGHRAAGMEGTITVVP